ncbi:MAG: hypothetical protein IPK99_17785 [Flavobacteriales bacterium]|nr:hypothetical protein [Flavobacteriales bacterium]
MDQVVVINALAEKYYKTYEHRCTWAWESRRFNWLRCAAVERICAEDGPGIRARAASP